ncbi:hypothetical protein BX616_009011, partial [Lobosporangium transversale]
ISSGISIAERLDESVCHRGKVSSLFTCDRAGEECLVAAPEDEEAKDPTTGREDSAPALVVSELTDSGEGSLHLTEAPPKLTLRRREADMVVVIVVVEVEEGADRKLEAKRQRLQ